MKKEKKNHENIEYRWETNEKEEKIIKKLDKEKNQEINIIFESASSTDVMTDILKQLSKYYIEEILKSDIV